MWPNESKARDHLKAAAKLLDRVLERNVGRLDDARSLYEDDEEDLRTAVALLSAAKHQL